MTLWAVRNLRILRKDGTERRGTASAFLRNNLNTTGIQEPNHSKTLQTCGLDCFKSFALLWVVLTFELVLKRLSQSCKQMYSHFESFAGLRYHHQTLAGSRYAVGGPGYAFGMPSAPNYYDPSKPAFDMETLKAGVRCATTGTGEVKAFIHRCTFRPREQAFTTLINMCGRLRDWTKALEVFDAMKHVRNVRPNTYTYSALISACGCAGEWKEALSVFNAMKVAAESDPGCRPNHVTFCALVTACERCGQHKAALDVFDEMVEAGIPADRVTWMAALSASDKLEKWDRVEKLLEEMHQVEIGGTVAVYCGLLHHYAEHNEWRKALAHFLTMQRLGVSVDEHVCKALMAALSAGAQWEMCLELLTSMDETRLIIDMDTYNLALAALAENGRGKEARDILAVIVKMAMKPNKAVLDNVVKACVNAGEKEAAQCICEEYKITINGPSLNETNSVSDDTNFDDADESTCSDSC